MAQVHPSDGDTIFALSSGSLPSAIAIVRVSGSRASDAIRALAGALPSPRTASFRAFRDDRDVLDHGILLWMPGPSTATGEDIAEFQVHGSRAVVGAIYAALEDLGLRMAEPGEFTRRALFNDRMDLSAVEGLADLLAAETESQRRDAIRRTSGRLSQKIEDWRLRLTSAAAGIEAAIDYDGEDETSEIAESAIFAALEVCRDISQALVIAPAERLHEGIRVAIVGPPNAGKSTLFNALVGRDVAIVSNIAGTTRDALERAVSIAGVPFVFVDTAGIRDTVDPIEREGVRRAKSAAETADIRIDLLANKGNAKTIAVSAKADIIEPRSGALAVSAIEGRGLADLQQRLCEMAQSMLPADGEVTFDRRYREALIDVRDMLSRIGGQNDIVLVAELVRSAIVRLAKLLGRDGIEDLLDALFGRFCLGK